MAIQMRDNHIHVRTINPYIYIYPKTKSIPRPSPSSSPNINGSIHDDFIYFQFRSETNIHVHTDESNENALSYFDGICYTEFAKLRDTCLDFYSFGA